MVTFTFTKEAEKKLKKLSKMVQRRIIEKLKDLKKHPDILSVLKKLYDFEPATHRLRIGEYRLILELTEQDNEEFVFFVLDVGHRKDIYK